MSKFSKNKFIINCSIVIIVSLTLMSIYFVEFYPRKNLLSIDTTYSLNVSSLIHELNDSSLDISSKSISLSTSINLTEEDFNNILINLTNKYKNKINQNNFKLNEIKAEINDDNINILFNSTYHKIPFRGNILFKPTLISNKIILHLDKFQVGFLDISRNIIFSKLNTNKFIEIDKLNYNIIFNINSISRFKIEDLELTDGNILIVAKSTINIYDVINQLIIYINSF